MTKIAIGCDHAGYELKEKLIKYLDQNDYEVIDLGAPSKDSVDYPDFVHPLASKIQSGEFKKGILICGTGNGVAMTANKYSKVRCGLCWNASVAALIRQHNDANIIALPARFVSVNDAVEMVDVFLQTKFEGGRHQRRIDKISKEENLYC
jgi:ribose 5-phosphate isomerase B